MARGWTAWAGERMLGKNWILTVYSMRGVELLVSKAEGLPPP